jgi:SNF family Na+-dependent transporter
MVLGGLIVTIVGTTFSSFQTSAAPMGLFGIIYLLLGLLYFFPTLYLYNFSQNIKKALVDSSQQNLDLGFENLKSFFKFIGVFSIVTISLYILLFVFAAVSAIIFAV